MRLIAVAFVLMAFGMGWLTLMYGWGLVPQSWPWIIGGTGASLVMTGISSVLTALAGTLDKDISDL